MVKYKIFRACSIETLQFNISIETLQFNVPLKTNLLQY